MIKTLTIGAGERIEFSEEGDFFRLMQAADPITVEYFANERRVVEAEEVNEGYAEKFETQKFQRVAITSATTQQLQFVIRNGNVVDYDQPPTGSVIVENNAGPFTQQQKTVTNASGQLLASNVDRRYLLIQNNDSTGIVYVNIAGAAAAAASGLKVLPGGSYECQGYVTTSAINAIGDIASNPNVVVVEG